MTFEELLSLVSSGSKGLRVRADSREVENNDIFVAVRGTALDGHDFIAQAIAAVVIGGTSLMGGRGSVVSSFFGVLIIAVLGTGLAQVGAQEPAKRLITGCVIVTAVILDYYRHRFSSKSL